MNTPDEELIEQYFKNALSKEDLQAFEMRLQSDPAFAEAVQLHAAALQAIRLEGSAALRARLLEKGRQLDQSTLKRKFGWVWLTGMLLIGALGWLWYQSGKPAPPPDAAPIPPQDIATMPPQTPEATTTQPPEIPQPETTVENRLFAAVFKPYRDPSIEPSRRGNENPSPSEQFQSLYWNGRYRDALQAFNTLSASTQKNDNLRFLKANCLLALGKAGEAENLLISIRENKQTRFEDQVDWYLALAQLGNNKRDIAQQQLQIIAENQDSPRKADARQLLQKLR